MSNDNKQQPQRSIPVREMQFDRNRMLPNGSISNVVQSAEAQANRPRFAIEYLPSLMFYRVAYYEPSATVPKKVMMYPREWASFEPVPQ